MSSNAWFWRKRKEQHHKEAAMIFIGRWLTLWTLLILLPGFGVIQAQQTASSAKTEQPSDLNSYKEENQRLKAENAQLRNENQLLRRMLAQPREAVDDRSAGTVRTITRGQEASVSTPSDQQETGYWMTASSGKRHNRNCRYYKNSRGRFCRPDEGIPCKICGG